MRIDRDSRGSLALVYIIGAALVAVFLCLIRQPWLSWPLSALVLWFCIWQTAFSGFLTGSGPARRDP